MGIKIGNGQGIILLLLFGVLAFILHYIFPGISKPYYWIAFYILCGIAELNEFRGRIFYVPMWLIGIIGFVISSRKEYEETGLLGSLILAVAIFGIGSILMRSINRKKWEKSRDALDLIKNSLPEEIEPKIFYKKLDVAFYTPSYLDPDNYIEYLIMEKLFDLGYKGNLYKQDVNRHYQDILEILEKQITEEEYKKYVINFHCSLKDIMDSKRVYIQQYMFENISMLINQRRGLYR